jgi:hypothetical protein
MKGLINMSLPTTRQGASLATQVPEGFSRNEGKTLMRLQNAEVTHGLVKATKVQAAAMVATVALQTTGMLSREANFQSDGDPATANRLNLIVDQFALYTAGEVSRFGY